MKHFTIFSMTVFLYTTQIFAIDYSKELKREFDESAQTIVGKFEKNGYTFMQKFEKCNNNALVPALCYQQVLNEVETEKAKNSKALRNCVIATVGIYTLRIATTALVSIVLPYDGVKAIDATIGAAQIPVNTSIAALTADQFALSALESKIHQKMSSAH
ncbi:MAG TPA: hypothetical protein VLG50_02355 [Candidatus Saccharimonadales bacterium]|nr:hypothetical protein [Candidatus Saccharimonadales bacterium]